MTLCEKPVKRRVRCNSVLVRGGELIHVLYPHGEIGLRIPGKRTEFKVGLADVWRVAIDITNSKFKQRVVELKKNGASLKDARKQARKELGLKKK
jgi:hypothetical protein